MEHFLLADLISPEILQRYQDAFSSYTGMAALITDANGTPLTTGSGFTRFCMDMTRCSEVGRKNCEECDRMGAIMTMQSGQTKVYRCHAGLTDYAAPILVNGEFIGSFIGGQVRTEPVDEVYMRERAIEYNIDPDDYIAAAKETNQIDSSLIIKAADFLAEMAGVFSTIAYERYKVLQDNQHIEQAAASQGEYFQRFATGLKDSLDEMSTYIENLVSGLLDEPVATNLNRLITNVVKLAGDLSTRMDYVGMVHGTFELHESIYDIRRIVDLRVTEVSLAAKEKNITFVIDIDEDVPTYLVGDPERVAQLFEVLISNAMEHLEDGEIGITISSEKKEYARMIEIEISDEGEGIDPETLENMNRYLKNRSKVSFENSEFEDMGFALMGYSVAAMSGTIDVTSKLGEGSTFTIVVPQLEAEGGI